MLETTVRRIGIAMPAAEFVNRGVLRGILKFVAENPPWSVVGGSFPAQATDVFRRWPPTGVITSMDPQAGYGVPTVAVIHPCPDGVRVAMDDGLTGLLAVHHFLERGFRNFAFVGYRGRWWSSGRERGFVSALRRLAPKATGALPRFLSGNFQSGRWQSSSRELVAWLGSLPKPVAVFACNDGRGRETVEAALTAGLRVPEDVAVLGVDNDDVECEMAHVPLSSVLYPTVEVGYRAAETLTRILDGRPVAQSPILIPPTGIRTRLSTDVLAVADAKVASAHRFIRSHVGEAIGVADVARAVGVSLRTLQLRYARAFDRAVHDDILQTRLALAKELLTGSRLTLKEVAARAGFGNAVYLSKVFQRELQTTPGALRRRESHSGVTLGG